MDMITLCSAVNAAIDAASLPQDIPLLLARQKIAMRFLREGDSDEIHALKVQNPVFGNWLLTDTLDQELTWPKIAAKKGWSIVTVASGSKAMTQTEQPSRPHQHNAVEVELNILVEEVASLADPLRTLIINIVNEFLQFAANKFRMPLPRLTETPSGVRTDLCETRAGGALFSDYLGQILLHLRAMREGIQEREPQRITLPIAMKGMAEIHQVLSELKTMEARTPEQWQSDVEAIHLAEWEKARDALNAAKRERVEAIKLANGFGKGPHITDPKIRNKLLAEAEAKVALTERQLEAADSKFPQQWLDQEDDPYLQHTPPAEG